VQMSADWTRWLVINCADEFCLRGSLDDDQVRPFLNGFKIEAYEKSKNQPL